MLKVSKVLFMVIMVFLVFLVLLFMPSCGYLPSTLPAAADFIHGLDPGPSEPDETGSSPTTNITNTSGNSLLDNEHIREIADARRPGYFERVLSGLVFSFINMGLSILGFIDPVVWVFGFSPDGAGRTEFERTNLVMGTFHPSFFSGIAVLYEAFERLLPIPLAIAVALIGFMLIIHAGSEESKRRQKDYLTAFVIAILALRFGPYLFMWIFAINFWLIDLIFANIIGAGISPTSFMAMIWGSGAEGIDALGNTNILFLAVLALIAFIMIAIINFQYYMRMITLGILIAIFPIVATLSIFPTFRDNLTLWFKEFISATVTQLAHAVVLALFFMTLLSWDGGNMLGFGFGQSGGEFWFILVFLLFFVSISNFTRNLLGLGGGGLVAGGAGAAIGIAALASVAKMMKGNNSTSQSPEPDGGGGGGSSGSNSGSNKNMSMSGSGGSGHGSSISGSDNSGLGVAQSGDNSDLSKSGKSKNFAGNTGLASNKNSALMGNKSSLSTNSQKLQGLGGQAENPVTATGTGKLMNKSPVNSEQSESVSNNSNNSGSNSGNGLYKQGNFSKLAGYAAAATFVAGAAMTSGILTGNPAAGITAGGAAAGSVNKAVKEGAPKIYENLKNEIQNVAQGASSKLSSDSYTDTAQGVSSGYTPADFTSSSFGSSSEKNVSDGEYTWSGESGKGVQFTSSTFDSATTSSLGEAYTAHTPQQQTSTSTLDSAAHAPQQQTSTSTLDSAGQDYTTAFFLSPSEIEAEINNNKAILQRELVSDAIKNIAHEKADYADHTSDKQRKYFT